jgi:heme/copper-type cytochrome/quinol oxidase subunit 3
MVTYISSEGVVFSVFFVSYKSQSEFEKYVFGKVVKKEIKKVKK